MRARGVPRESADRDRHGVGPMGGHADRLDRLAARLRQDRRADQAAELALVGRHRMRRIALGVLDMGIALAMGEADVLGGDVVLQVDEALAGRLDLPERRERLLVPAELGQGEGESMLEACPGRSGLARLGAVMRGSADTEDAARRAGGTLRLHRLARDMARQPGVPLRPGAGLAGELDVRVPAAREAEQVCDDGVADRTAALAQHRGLAVEAGDLGSEPDLNAARRHDAGKLALRPGIDERHPA